MITMTIAGRHTRRRIRPSRPPVVTPTSQLLAMNATMNTLLDTEIDEPDDGSFLPGKDANWAATRFDP
jgi:hypothetical protein